MNIALRFKRTNILMGFRKLVILLIAALVTTLLSSCNQGSEEIVAFTYVNLIPMNSERTIENQTVLVKGSKIIAIYDSDTMQILRKSIMSKVRPYKNSVLLRGRKQSMCDDNRKLGLKNM